MSLPPDPTFVDDSTEPPEDPLGLFVSEYQKTVQVPSGTPPPAVHMPDWRRFDVLKIVSLARFLAVVVARQIAARTPLPAVTVIAFACGVVVGGSVAWLSGASRQAVVESTAPRQAPREVPHAAAPPVAQVATASASTPVVQIADSHTAPPTAGAAVRRPRFRGSLVVNSRPSGARVFVNGLSVGHTPLVLRNQPIGSRAIRFEMDGYEPWSAAVQVVADTEARLRAELRAQRPAAQP
jgi:PEGA domain-containing protein